MAKTPKKTGAALPATTLDGTTGKMVKVPSHVTVESYPFDPKIDYAEKYATLRSDLLKAEIRALVREVQAAANVCVSKTKQLYPALAEMEGRYNKRPGKLDVDVNGAKTWYEFLQSVGVKPSAFKMWKLRSVLPKSTANNIEALMDETEEVPADSDPNAKPVSPIPPVRPSSRSSAAKPTTEGDPEREQATQPLLEAAKEAQPDEYEVTVTDDHEVYYTKNGEPIDKAEWDARPKHEEAAQTPESEVLTPASNAAPLPPLPGATFTREQANADATMRQATELVGKQVWLAQSADAFVLVLAFDKATAEEIANLNDVVPVSCINVNVAETAVIMQGVIDECRGFWFSMKEPSEVEKAIEAEMSKTAAQLSGQTDAKKPVQSETTADELVEAG